MFALHQSVKVLVKLFQKLAGLGRAHKNGAFFLPSFFFAPLVPKKKRDYAVLCFFVGKGNFLKEAFLPPHPQPSRTLKLGFYFFIIISAHDDNKNKILLFFGRKLSSRSHKIHTITTAKHVILSGENDTVCHFRSRTRP